MPPAVRVPNWDHHHMGGPWGYRLLAARAHVPLAGLGGLHSAHLHPLVPGSPGHVELVLELAPCAGRAWDLPRPAATSAMTPTHASHATWDPRD